MTGLYFYPAGVPERAAKIQPGRRGEYEITDLNRVYLEDGLLDVVRLADGFTWMDAGTVSSLQRAARFVEAVQGEAGTGFSVPEEIAFRNGWISRAQLLAAAEEAAHSPYGQFLKKAACQEAGD